jgi:hypothetical protein
MHRSVRRIHRYVVCTDLSVVMHRSVFDTYSRYGVMHRSVPAILRCGLCTEVFDLAPSTEVCEMYAVIRRLALNCAHTKHRVSFMLGSLPMVQSGGVMAHNSVHGLHTVVLSKE